MSVWESPAKLNLSLEVGPLERDGLHPLRSLVTCLDWFDLIRFEEADEDELVVTGADLPLGGENLIWKAIGSRRPPGGRPQLHIELSKSIAIAAGLGGGSSNAATALAAWADLTGTDVTTESAAAIGADAPLFLQGGWQWMEGYGEKLTRLKKQPDLAVAIVVPPFELDTGEVYRAWDRAGEPQGSTLDARQLPPQLRDLGPLRNDLTPAALSINPELGDYIEDLRARWGQPVLMSGSGPALFSWFSDPAEASDAIVAAPRGARSVRAASSRSNGVERVE